MAGTNTGTPAIWRCSFTNNASYAANLSGINMGSCGGNSGSGNGTNVLGFSGDMADGHRLSPNEPGLPYGLVGTTAVISGRSFTLAPGVRIKATSEAQLSVGGTLRAQGTADSLVVLTSIHDDSVDGDSNANGAATNPAPGNWRGLVLNGYSAYWGWAELEHVQVRYGGAAGSGIHCYAPESAILRHCRCEFSSTAGLLVEFGSPLLENCVFTNNTSEGVRIISGGEPMLGDLADTVGGGNVIAGNLGAYQLYNSSGHVIQACFNDWGVDDPAAIDALIRDDEESTPANEVVFVPQVKSAPPAFISRIIPTTQQGDSLAIYWTPVRGATGYVLESSTLPYDGFAPHVGGSFVRNHWEGPRDGVSGYFQLRVVTPDE